VIHFQGPVEGFYTVQVGGCERAILGGWRGGILPSEGGKNGHSGGGKNTHFSQLEVKKGVFWVFMYTKSLESAILGCILIKKKCEKCFRSPLFSTVSYQRHISKGRYEVS
jgi:hypothetical protein